MGAHHRDKIRKSNILSRLIAHVEGERQITETEDGKVHETDLLSTSQVTAALGLMGFAFPKLQPVDANSGSSAVHLKVTIGGDD